MKADADDPAVVELRTRAEAAVAKNLTRSPQDVAALSPEAARSMLHELQTHQIELEMQNENLRRAEVELEASRARYFDLYDLAPVGYATVSETGTILEGNLTLATLLGMPRGALVQRPFSRFILGEDQDKFYLLGRRVLDTGAMQSCELRMLKDDGTQFWAQLAESATKDTADVPVYSVVLTDITERKLAQDEIARATREWQATLDSSNDAIWILDAEQRVLRSNKTAERFFHRPCSEMLGEHCWAIVHGTATPHPQCPFVRARLSMQRETMRLHDGRRWLEIVVDPIFDAAGRHTGAVHVVRDISERIRGEEDLAQMQVRLHRTERMDSLGTLAGGVAHDFNNILGAILGNTELAAQDVGPDHAAAESLAEIRKASLRAKDLVHRILDFASHGQEVLRVISLRPVVEEAVTLLHSSLPATVEITTTFGSETPAVLADLTQIQQMLINLSTNSWHAMQGRAGRIDIHLDGITLGAEAAHVNPELSPGRFARLRIIDTGSGMNAATLERIFEPFFTTKAVGQGTGLGLSVVHGIVKAHSGAISVTSRSGEGTAFTVYFPAAVESGQGAAPQGLAAKPLGASAGKHVLYLDDEGSLVFLATRMLKRLGYRVSGYTSAAEALEAVRSDPGQFDLVVTDFNMPGISGLDVALELARLRPDLPVVLASGYVTDELRAQARDAGVREVIYKPNTVEELCATVQRMLDTKQTP